MRERSSEHSRVLSDVSLVPEHFGISVVWLAKLAIICIVILWIAIYDINFLPIALMIDVGVVIVAVTGRLITPPHLDSFTGFVRARLAQRWGQDRLVSEPSHETTTDNE